MFRKPWITGMPARPSFLFSMLLLGATLLALGLNRVSIYDEVVLYEAPSLSGFEEIQSGVFRAVSGQNVFHSFAALTPLIPNTYYRIQYDVQRLAREKVTLTTDLYAPGYDNSTQEFRKVLVMNELGKHQDFIINSGKAPEHAHFRIFYGGESGFEVANIEITRVPTWSIWLKRGLLTGAFGTIIVIITMFVMNQIKSLSTLSQPVENSSSRILAADVPPVMVVYLCAVIIRYIMYITMPYWSGDEYVYKTIAAGIWHYGHHGELTDTMVSHSVNLPNLLYPYLISPAFALGENFYFGVRLINALVINMAIFPCYLIARKFLDRAPALATSSIAIAIPFVNIGAFAVTEVLFFPLFLLCIWVAIESIEKPKSIMWIISFGIIAAVLMNVRLNALVLMPAYLFSFLWISIKRNHAKDLIRRPYWFLAIVAFIVTHILLQYLLGAKEIGELGLYTKHANNSDGAFTVIFNNPTATFHLVIGHLTTLAIPFALPIALIIYTILVDHLERTVTKSFYNFILIITVFSSALFILALAFTISVSPVDLGGLGRWHSRYYFYFYPLIIIAGAVFLKKNPDFASPSRIVVIFTVILLIAANLYFIVIYDALLNPWFGSIVDNMDVQWYKKARAFYWLFIIFSFSVAWLWYKRSTYFTQALICFICTWVIVANYGTLRAAGAGTGAVADACGSLSQNFLSQHPGRFVVVGDSRATMVGTAFWNQYIPERAFIYNESTKPINSEVIGVPTDYTIVNGDIQVSTEYQALLSIGNCTIYKQPI